MPRDSSTPSDLAATVQRLINCLVAWVCCVQRLEVGNELGASLLAPRSQASPRRVGSIPDAIAARRARPPFFAKPKMASPRTSSSASDRRAARHCPPSVREPRVIVVHFRVSASPESWISAALEMASIRPPSAYARAQRTVCKERNERLLKHASSILQAAMARPV